MKKWFYLANNNYYLFVDVSIIIKLSDMNTVTYLDWLQEQCGLDHIIKFTESKDNNFFCHYWNSYNQRCS